MGKGEPLSPQASLEDFGGSDGQSKAGSEGLGLGNAVAVQLEQGDQPPFFGQENFEAELEALVFDEGFFADERFVRLDIGRGNKFEWANEITVLIVNPGEVRFIGEEPIFLAVMEASDVLEDQAFDFPENGLQVWGSGWPHSCRIRDAAS